MTAIRLSIVRTGSKPLTLSAGNRHDARRRQSQVARQAAQALLPAGEWHILADGRGRPLVVDSRGSAGPDLSLSHSGDWAAAALAETGRVGVDIETARPGRDVQGLARAYLTAPEQARVAAGGQDSLLALWAMREALAKLDGGGLAVALALDGAALPHGLGGWCRARVGERDCVVAQRSRGEIHAALAWSGPDAAGPVLLQHLDRALEAA